MTDAIGGYFEKEPRTIEEHAIPQKDCILLNTARNAFEYILRSIPNLRGVYLPYYTCNVMLEPLKRLFGVSFACPMAYPFMDARKREWRYKMKGQRIFIPKFWPNVISYGHFDFEAMLADRIMPLPIDQRYNEEDMKRILKLII